MSETDCRQLGVFENVHNFIVAGSNDELTDEHWTSFERLLQESDDACRLYAQYVGVSVLLPSILSAISSEESPTSNVFSPERHEPVVHLGPTFLSTALHGTVGWFSSGWPVAYLIATVISGIALVIGALTPVSQPEQVAGQSSVPSRVDAEPKTELVGRITGMVDCKWMENPKPEIRNPKQIENQKSEIRNQKSVVSLGDEFALASGLMEITYDTGAKVILQGPMAYEVESRAAGICRLAS